MKDRLESINHFLTNQTVLSDWFSPLRDALDTLQFNDNIFNTLSMQMFVLTGCLRQLRSQKTLREQVQSLFHLNENAVLPPLARSTWSDALASPKRRDITRDAFSHLVAIAQSVLPDRLKDIKSLGNRDVFAIDASYQNESTHYGAVYPGKDESKKQREQRDNPKGHMLMTMYDLRKGLPVDLQTETKSRGEMRVIKESTLLNNLLTQKKRSMLLIEDLLMPVIGKIRIYSMAVRLLPDLKAP